MIDYNNVEKQEVKFTVELLEELVRDFPKKMGPSCWLADERPEGRFELLTIRTNISEVLPHIKFVEDEEKWLDRVELMLARSGFKREEREKFVELFKAMDFKRPQRSTWAYADNIGGNGDCLVGYLGASDTFLFTLSKEN